MKVYITKYALTHGIIATDATPDRKEPTMIRVKHGAGLREFRGNDWHSYRRDAIARSAEMRDLRILSLNRQRDRLDRIKF